MHGFEWRVYLFPHLVISSRNNCVAEGTRKDLIVLGSSVLVALAVFILIAFVTSGEKSQPNGRDAIEGVETKTSGMFRSWATAVDTPQCTHVSKEIYDLGLGVTCPQGSGIGGGFYAVYFNK